MCVEHLSDHHQGEGGINMSCDSRDLSNLDTFFRGKGVWIRELGSVVVVRVMETEWIFTVLHTRTHTHRTSSVTPTEVEPATLSATSGLDTSHQLEESASKEVCIYVYTNQPHSYMYMYMYVSLCFMNIHVTGLGSFLLFLLFLYAICYM